MDPSIGRITANNSENCETTYDGDEPGVTLQQHHKIRYLQQLGRKQAYHSYVLAWNMHVHSKQT